MSNNKIINSHWEYRYNIIHKIISKSLIISIMQILLITSNKKLTIINDRIASCSARRCLPLFILLSLAIE